MNLLNVPMAHPVFAGSNWSDAAWHHQAVMALFGELPSGTSGPRAAADILYRVEDDRPAHDGSRGRVLVQTTAAPTAEGLRVTDLTPVLDSYETGRQVRLMLRANTVRTVNCTCDGDGQRPPAPRPGVTPHTHRLRVPEPDLPHWFANKMRGAVDIPKITIRGRADSQVPKVEMTPGELRRGRAQLITTDFYATGTIDDPGQLARLVRSGVGRAKPYGCGMLTALPV